MNVISHDECRASGCLVLLNQFTPKSRFINTANEQWPFPWDDRIRWCRDRVKQHTRTDVIEQCHILKSRAEDRTCEVVYPIEHPPPLSQNVEINDVYLLSASSVFVIE